MSRTFFSQERDIFTEIMGSITGLTEAEGRKRGEERAVEERLFPEVGCEVFPAVYRNMFLNEMLGLSGILSRTEQIFQGGSRVF